MAITRTRVRSGLIVAEVLTTDLEGDAATVAAEIDAVDPGAEAMLRGYIDAAEEVLNSAGAKDKGNAKRPARWIAARACRIHAREAIRYLRAGAAESAVFNALVAAHNAWIADIKKVEPAIVSGVKATRQRSKAGFSSGKERKDARQPEWRAWQDEADRLRMENPDLKKSRIFEIVAVKFNRTRRAIAQRVTWVGTERPRSRK